MFNNIVSKVIFWCTRKLNKPTSTILWITKVSVLTPFNLVNTSDGHLPIIFILPHRNAILVHLWRKEHILHDTMYMHEWLVTNAWRHIVWQGGTLICLHSLPSNKCAHTLFLRSQLWWWHSVIMKCVVFSIAVMRTNSLKWEQASF